MTLRGILSGPSSFGEGVQKLHRSLALKGSAFSPSETASTVLPYCAKPIRMGRRSGPKHGLERSIETSLWVACRRCAKCLKFRRLRWRERIEVEGQKAPRSWFCLFTFDPVIMAGILAEAHLAAGKAGWSPGDKPSFDRFVDEAAYSHLQRFLKRLRKTGAKFRYVAVFERGSETNRPHYHMLVHEIGLGSVLWRQFADAKWPSLVWSAKLVRESDALRAWRYLSKYLGKSLDIRPRASKNYGTKKKDDAPFKLF